MWLITGAQASGKSTIAELLAKRFARSVHVRGGQFYRWAVRGWTHFDGADQSEARRLLELRYELSSMVADRYAAAGFTTVVQDNIYGADTVAWLDRIAARRLHLVVLRPSPDVLAHRHDERRRATGKVAYREAFTPEDNDREVATISAALGLWLDTSDLDPHQTVDRILECAVQARVHA